MVIRPTRRLRSRYKVVTPAAYGEIMISFIMPAKNTSPYVGDDGSSEGFMNCLGSGQNERVTHVSESSR